MNRALQDFIESSFRSVWSVEILLLLRRQARAWTADELVRELRSSEVVVAQSIESLIASGLVVIESDGGIRYRPALPDSEALVDQLQDLYVKRPAAVRRLIVQNPTEQLKTFSDAFRFRDK